MFELIIGCEYCKPTLRLDQLLADHLNKPLYPEPEMLDSVIKPS
jgi:hypothetical protein